jgi:Fe-S-cluster containining protein
VKEGFIGRANLYTIRCGELVRDNIHDKLETTEKEIIKIKEKQEGKGCVYYDEEAKGCEIYEHRPMQCEALACWDVSKFMQVYEGSKATRREILHDKILLSLVEEHDRKCSYHNLETFAKQIKLQGERPIDKIIELLKFDYYLRPFVSEKMGIDSSEMDFLFGRPLTETITMFGLQVNREPDGSFFLTVLDSSNTR